MEGMEGMGRMEGDGDGANGGDGKNGVNGGLLADLQQGIRENIS